MILKVIVMIIFKNSLNLNFISNISKSTIIITFLQSHTVDLIPERIQFCTKTCKDSSIRKMYIPNLDGTCNFSDITSYESCTKFLLICSTNLLYSQHIWISSLGFIKIIEVLFFHFFLHYILIQASHKNHLNMKSHVFACNCVHHKKCWSN